MDELSKFVLVIRTYANDTEPCLEALHCTMCDEEAACDNTVTAMDKYQLMGPPRYATKIKYTCEEGTTMFANDSVIITDQEIECQWNGTFTDLSLPLTCTGTLEKDYFSR